MVFKSYAHAQYERKIDISSNKMAAPTLVSSWKCFGGLQKVFKHQSKVLKCEMKFAIYLPPQAVDKSVPVVYWLSGLTCTQDNFIQKAGAQRYAADLGVAIVCPDTSPRGCNIEGEDDSYDFGSGAGFYLNATEDKWKTNYSMFSYVTDELPKLVESNFPLDASNRAITGHSMGGHGALVCYLKNPGFYKSVSAFAPICNPSNCPWGTKAFTGYLGNDKATWKEWDATELVKNYTGPPKSYILIDQGKDDNFLTEKQLLPQNFVEACKDNSIPVVLRMQEGYDHSYYFIASLIGEHLEHLAKAFEQ